jgi:hypothetical protein
VSCLHRWSTTLTPDARRDGKVTREVVLSTELDLIDRDGKGGTAARLARSSAYCQGRADVWLSHRSGTLASNLWMQTSGACLLAFNWCSWRRVQAPGPVSSDSWRLRSGWSSTMLPADTSLPPEPRRPWTAAAGRSHGTVGLQSLGNELMSQANDW